MFQQSTSSKSSKPIVGPSLVHSTLVQKDLVCTKWFYRVVKFPPLLYKMHLPTPQSCRRESFLLNFARVCDPMRINGLNNSVRTKVRKPSAFFLEENPDLMHSPQSILSSMFFPVHSGCSRVCPTRPPSQEG